MFFFLWPIDGPLLIQLALVKSRTLDKQISIRDWSHKKNGYLRKQPGLYDLMKEALHFQEHLCLEWLAAIRAAKPEPRPVMAKASLAAVAAKRKVS